MKILLISVLVLILIIVFKRNTRIAIRAKMLFAKGDSEGAIKCFARADKGGGLRAEQLMTYGFILLKSGRCEEARVALNRAHMSASKPQIRQRIKAIQALVEWKSGSLQNAIEMLEEVNAEFKTTAVYQDLGLLYILSGDKQKALEYNKEAYEYNSDDLVITDNMAEAYALCGDYTHAAELYETLLEKEAHFPEPYYGYGLLLIDRGERERGIELIRESLDKRFTFLSVKSRAEVEEMLRGIEEETK